MIRCLLKLLPTIRLNPAKRIVPLLSTVVAASAVNAATDTSCDGPVDLRGASAVFPRGGSHDPRLIAEAVLAEVNAARCVASLNPLATDPTLNRAATIHTFDMITHRFYAHRSPVSGRETPLDRVIEAGGRFRLTAENLGQGWYMDYEPGRPFITDDEAACRFRYTDGTEIQRHSYASLAEDLVAAWMASPGHRENILREGITLHGFSVAPTGDTTLCGKLYATQLFAR